MPGPSIVVALLGASGLFLAILTAARLRRRRLLAATRSGLGACTCLLLAGSGLALALNLYTYQRLTYEQDVATLRFHRLEDRHYRVELRQPDGRVQQFELRGDQWQLDARILKWQPLANLMGFDALLRLDRLSGRYAEAATASREPHSAHTLVSHEPGLDAWALARRLPRHSMFIDSEYGSATYMPMADDAEYEVAATQSGLVARPANTAARAVTHRW